MDGFMNSFIRPYRLRYSLIDMGNRKTDKYQRIDGFTKNKRGFKLCYSYYQNKTPTNVCVIYAHCNSGSRLEGMVYINHFIQKGWNVALFDFAGSGISEGEFISLGFYQADDLDIIVKEMELQGNRRFLLWGRSMGASTILRYLQNGNAHQNIYGCVLDSPYSNLEKLATEIGVKTTNLPEFLVSGLLKLLRGKILQEHGFDIYELNLVKNIDRVRCPLMFITSQKDTFVNSSHTKALFDKFEGKKSIEYIQSQHNTPRKQETIQIGIKHFERCSNRKKKKIFEIYSQSARNVDHIKVRGTIDYFKETINLNPLPKTKNIREIRNRMQVDKQNKFHNYTKIVRTSVERKLSFFDEN